MRQAHRPRARALIALFAAFALAPAGCAPPPPPPPQPPPDRFAERLAETQRLFAAGEVTAAIARLQALAAEGSPAAQLQLAALHLRGFGVPRDPREAVRLFERAAAAGSAAGMRELGEAYLDGAGVAQDPARGRAWLLRAAEAGDPGARLRLALIEAEDPGSDAATKARAERAIEQIAREGYVHAQLTLADRLAEGRGRRRDLLEAHRWYAVALEPLRAEAEAGEPRAQERLGDLYRDGRGVRADGAKAVEWYRRAAEGGRPSALIRLARIFERGAAGLPPDEAEASRWLALAAE
ncbi:MAG: sel1 repeat family protein, partial [Geminicoccaceae bacterium]|nr:sel1 repeat family protein [Geminicoccaceae bacterium]